MKELEHPNNDELNEAPFLGSLGKPSFFEAPEGYFDRLPGILADRLADLDPVGEAPVLREIGQKTIFQVPPGYFEALPERILSRIREEQRPGAIVRSLWSQAFVPQNMLSVAAVVLLFVLGVWVMPRSVDSPQVQAHPFTSDELLAMVDVEAIDTETLIEILGEESIRGLDLIGDWEMEEEEMGDLLDQMDLDDFDAGEVW